MYLTNTSRIQKYKLFSRITSLIAVIVGASALLGWLLDNPFLKGLHPSNKPMNPITAVCSILLGISLFIQAMPKINVRAVLNSTGKICAFIVLVIAAMKLMGLFCYDFGIDKILFTQRVKAYAYYGEMTPVTAIALLLLSISLLILKFQTHKGFRPSEIIATISFLCSGLILAGYIYQVKDLGRLTFYGAPMALNSAIIFSLLALGILCTYPNRGLMAIITSENLGGRLARRNLPLIIVIPVVLAWIRLSLEKKLQYYGFEFGLVVMIILDVILIAVVIFWNAHLLNVLDYRRAESDAKTHELEKQIDFILGATKTGIDIIDSNFNMLYVNSSWAKVYGDYHGKKCYEYFMGRSEVCPGCGVKKALETKKPVVTEEKLAKEGDRPIQVTTIPFQNDNGEWLVAEINVDITERKKIEERIRNLYAELDIRVKVRTAELSKANEDLNTDIAKRKEVEKALRDSEVRFKTIFNESRDGQILADAQTMKFIMCNKKVCEMLGYTEKELLLLGVDNIHPTESIPHVREVFAAQARGDLKLAEGLPIKRKDGSVFHADINTSSISLAGKKYLMGSFRDVTERLKAEEIRNNIMNMISHELKTPLVIIKEDIALVTEGKVGAINEKQKSILTAVKNNAEKLSHLTSHILDFQKIDSGMMEFYYEENDINKLIQDIYKDMLPLIKKKKLESLLKLDNELPLIKFDKEKIAEVLINLISNAVKFTEKGSITISTSRVGDFAQVLVKDTGHGIHKDDMPKIFQRFAQLEIKTGGTGLGLAIAKEIINAHKGKIWIESEFNKGTNIYFTLPINKTNHK